MRGKSRSISFYSTFLILALIAFGLCSVQGFQATQPTAQLHQLTPPPPSAPYWTYTTGGDVRAVAVSADGGTIVAGSYDNKIYVFARQNNATLWNYNTGSTVQGVTVSRDGTTIATGGFDGYFRVFGRTSNVTLVQYNAGASIYRAIAVASDGSTIACGGTGASPKAYLFSKSLGLLWDFSIGGAVGGSVTPGGPAVGVSGDGSLIAYGYDDSKLYVFQYDTTPPLLGTPSALPSSPVGGQSVNISVSVTDNVAASTVTLYYRDASASSWSSVAMSFPGSVYRAKVGPFPSGSTIGYYVTAIDTSGNTANSPADAPLSYFVLTVGQPSPAPGIEWTSVLIGAGLGALIAIVVSLVLIMRGKKSRR